MVIQGNAGESNWFYSMVARTGCWFHSEMDRASWWFYSLVGRIGCWFHSMMDGLSMLFFNLIAAGVGG